MAIHYEEEIIMDILSRLPVRSLLRFKCVSKFWETLISESYFKMKHLSHANNDFNSQKLLVGQKWFSNRVMFNLYSSSLSSDQLVQDVQNLPSNYTRAFGISNIYSSCNGLVLLGVDSDIREQFLLWNPSTRESIDLALPCSGFRLKDATFGLGYDTNSDGYKILKLNNGKRLLPSTEIFTLKSGSWRSIFKNPTFVCQDLIIGPVVFVHGAFHWLGYSHSHSVVSFSTSNEVYRDIPLLEGMYRVDHIHRSNYGISVFGGMLCFYSTHNCHQGCTNFQLWGMKDYGVMESWTELFTLHASDIYFPRPKYRYADGEVLLCCRLDMSRGGRGGDVFRIYNSNNNNNNIPSDIFRTSKGKCGLWHRCSFHEGIVYTESLIFPKLLI